MRSTDFADVLPAFRQAQSVGKKIMVITHEWPDGDAVGSSCAMTLLLRANGFRADLCLPDQMPDCYKPFVEGMIAPYPTTEILNRDYAMVVNTDASTVKRLGLGPVSFDGIRLPFITLDHHPDDEIFGTVSYVDPAACSASQIVWQFARYANWNISAEAATFLLLGITTDTGCFRFSNASPDAHRAAAELLELGADNARIMNQVYFSKPFNMAMFEAELLQKVRTAFDGRFAWVYAEPELLQKYSINLRNTEQLIELIRGIEGVELAALLKPTANPGIFKVSLRSKKPSISAGRIARQLNGGGHEMAAGGSIFSKTSSEAEEILLQHATLEFEHEKQSE